MAMNKIERLDREIQKTREKITEYQNKLSGDTIPGMAALPADGYAEEQEDAANEE